MCKVSVRDIFRMTNTKKGTQMSVCKDLWREDQMFCEYGPRFLSLNLEKIKKVTFIVIYINID